ncbi:TIGR03936 family radical SAM-associated protein [Anaeroglobus geminatus]|uniref:Radical SAM-linked protein n=1 Tax=Anaeroglobus geminatus F0357 TaxID=861450 RepID=G9YGA5_9FIRM|nr:TIGR03936 family radical SAM-associated protein [Anaeroglobus geminatus]EHM42308.1 radical SAM-linked protein [Anaeroglobus geminatus F0357]
MARLRLAIKKDNALQFLSHLDFARAVRLIVIRADLPVLYSEGFNPHMKLSFASALGVGVAADEEFMDLELAKEIPVDDVMARMNEKSPLGFAVLCGKYIDQKAPKLMAGGQLCRLYLTRPRDGEDYGKRPGTVITVI